jgi:capsular exopolysaccharide synthesis family protein
MAKNGDSRRAASGLFDIESPMAIELRRIMIRLGKDLDLGQKRAIMVTSAERGEGKSLFSLHFSLVLAYHLSSRILLIDGDVRRPVQHTVFEEELAPGFVDLLDHDTKDRQGLASLAGKVTRQTPVKNLDFLAAGKAGGHPSRLFGASNVKEVVAALHQTYDLIILDSPPVVPVSDPLHYLNAVDGVLYMVMAGQTPKDVSARGVELLRSAGANILGAIANNLSEVLPYYYDQKYYGYTAGKKKRRA